MWASSLSAIDARLPICLSLCLSSSRILTKGCAIIQIPFPQQIPRILNHLILLPQAPIELQQIHRLQPLILQQTHQGLPRVLPLPIPQQPVGLIPSTTVWVSVSATQVSSSRTMPALLASNAEQTLARSTAPASATLVSVWWAEFVRGVLRGRCGVQLQISASLSAGKTRRILPRKGRVCAIRALVCTVVLARCVPRAISSLTATA